VAAPDTLKLRPDKVAWRDVDDELIALDLDAAVYLSVNRAGAALWPALAEGTTRDALVAALEERFSIPNEAAATDVDTFLGQLSGLDLLEE
jgi:hypothetical protein